MSRPQDVGLKYFSLDVDMDQDDKTMMIEGKYGILGFGIVVKLFMKIYREGYFYPWTEKEQLLFARRNNVDINVCNDVVNDCIKWGFFAQKLYAKYQVLSSSGIQKRYLAGVKRRQSVDLIKEYLLVDPKQILEKSKVRINLINVNKNLTDVNIAQTETTEMLDTGTQSKVKKSNKYIVEIIDYLNNICGKNFKINSKATVRKIEARLKEGFTVEDFQRVIDKKASQWLNDPHWSKYLRPETLFGTKFESYLNEAPKQRQNKYGTRRAEE